MARYCKTILAVCLSLSLGLHWCLLQSVAWASMLVERSQQDSFVTALQTTFDGQHPCKLCRIVRDGQQAEKKADRQLKVQKLETAAIGCLQPRIFPPQRDIDGARTQASWSACFEVPPLPPPRLA